MERIVKVVEPCYEMIRSTIYSLRGRYPFLQAFSLGNSLLGHEIYAMSLGETRNRVLYAGAFHGQEWITALILLLFAEDLCYCLDSGQQLAGMDVRRSLLGRGVVIVPCVNPDGVEIALKGSQGAPLYASLVEKISGGDFSNWNANARGVDINHNFNAGWQLLREMEIKAGITGPAPRQYGGEAPESEPETQALTKLCRDRTFRHVLALHSQGEEIFWHYGPKNPPRAKLMAQIMAASTGYKLENPQGMACYGGFKDWFISEFGRPGFTVEVGKGKNPLPIEQTEEIYNRIVEMLMLTAVM